MEQFYTIEELAEAEWFPINSAPTIRLAIFEGKLKVINVGRGKIHKKLFIKSDDAVDFVKKTEMDLSDRG